MPSYAIEYKRTTAFNPSKLFEARAVRRVTQQELAEKTGLGRSYISRLETGYSEPSADTLVKIADVLLVSIDWLCDRSEVRDRR